MGYKESSFLRLSNKSYIYTPHEQQGYSGAISEVTKIGQKKLMFRIGRASYVINGVSENLKPDGYSIMSTPCFIHRAYLRMYFDPLIVPASAVKYVEELRSCEDILLSIVVTKFLQDSNRTQCGVLATVGPVHHTGNSSLVSLRSFFSRFFLLEGVKQPSPSLNSQRSQCLNWFFQLYEYLPLQLSNIMAISN